MINIELNGTAPTHVERIAPQFSVDETGKITWLPGLVDYDASLFYRGKTVTNDEFNTLFLRNVYQGNYITDSLSELFDEHLNTAIYRSFTSDFNLVPSYVKSFGPSDWGTLQSDGYYYITIPASEHGFEPDDEEATLDKMNIDTEMYLLGTDGRFYEVTQVDTDSDNTVRLYTDDNTLSGFVVIRTNDKSYALAAATIDATQISGLAKVATSAKYTDLIDRTTPTGPDTRIAANAANIAALMSDTEYEDYPFVHNADFATNATNANYATNLLGTGTIQNQPISTIFETGSNYVKNATTATNVSTTINGNAITNIFEEDGITVKKATDANSADSATNVSTTINNKNISDIFETDGVTVKNATKVNNLEIKRDENNILKIDDIIIQQKKLLWSGEQSMAIDNNISIPINIDKIQNKTFEIVFKPEKYTSMGSEFVGYAPISILVKTYEDFIDVTGGQTSYNSTEFEHTTCTSLGVTSTSISITPYLQRSSNQNYIRIVARADHFDWNGDYSDEEIHMAVIKIYEIIE